MWKVLAIKRLQDNPKTETSAEKISSKVIYFKYVKYALKIQQYNNES